jgi:DNA polymerase III subunit delta'
MIQEKLSNDHKINKLHNSYLIKSDDLDKALEEVKSFLAAEMFREQDFSRNDDFRIISKAEGNVKNISIDQVRQLQLFLSKSSVLSGKKVGLIYDAEHMNLNASNACLKILEDTPKNSYLFLLAKNMSAILPTIRSRCVKINCMYSKANDDFISDIYINPLLKTTSMQDRLNFIKEFAKKDRDLWLGFSTSAEVLINKFCRKMIDPNYSLSESETKLFNQLGNNSLARLQSKYKEISTIAENTIKYDLDLRASCVLLIEAFYAIYR